MGVATISTATRSRPDRRVKPSVDHVDHVFIHHHLDKHIPDRLS